MMSAETLYRAARTRLPLAVLAVLAACSGDKNRESNSPLTGSDNPNLAITSKPNKQDWKQCENGKNFDSQCSWTTGNLTATANTYREGDVVPHILRISSINANTPIDIPIAVQYGFKKAGKSTHDFLADWNHTMKNALPCTDTNFDAFCTVVAGKKVLKPISATSNIISMPSNITTTDKASYEAAVNAPGAPAQVIRGIGVSKIVVSTPVLDDPTGNDVEADVTITITPEPGVTEALILIGSHVARGKDWPNGGASSVPGSPYHVALGDIGGFSGGSMDLQMNSDAVIPDTKLTLVKLIDNGDGGTAQLADFPLTAAGPVTITGVSGSAAVTGALVVKGTYALSEQTNPNYTASLWSCKNADGSTATVTNASVTLDEGADVTCTITNDDIAGSLQLVKIVKNDNGGTATVSNFGIVTSAGTPVWTPSGSAPTITYTSQEFTVKAGSYTFTESDVSGYAEGTWACSGAAATGTAFNGGSVTVPLNTKVVCTITNDDNPGSLTLVKKVINDNGGTAVIGDFGITTTAGTPAFTSQTVGSTTTYTSAPISVNAGSYTLVEKDLAAYAEGSWSCTSGLQSGTATGGSVTVAASTAVVCTIENNDIAGTLQVVKKVVNDNGGTASVAAFGLSTSAGGLQFGAGTVAGSTTTYSSQVITVTGGQSYTLRENDIAGYTEGTWSCTGATPSNITISQGAVTVPLATNVVCTITNDDQAGSLQIVKKVINDNGGTATVSAFGLATTAGSLQFDGGAVSGSTTTYTSQAIAVATGSYTLRENDVAGYLEGKWSCTGATPSNVSFNAGAVTVPAGGAVVCTIENNDIGGSLQIIKNVVNDNGGTATVAAFGLATSAGSLTFDGGTASGTTTTYTSQVLTVPAGSYTLRENDLAAYTEGTWSCTGATPSNNSISAGAVTVPLGTAVVCSITNDDNFGKLQLVKKVVNDDGGTAKVGAFGLATSAGSLQFDAGTTVGSTTTYTSQKITVPAGASYTLRENDVAGYTEGTWNCTGATPSNTTISAGAVTVPSGGDVVCTIENNDQPGTLIVTKVVKGEGNTFNFTVTGPSIATVTSGITVAANSSNTRTYSDLDAGAYSVTETTVDGYVLTDLSCNVATTAADVNTASLTVTVPNGATVTCTFVNNGAKTTRTQGFWQTHTGLLHVALFGGKAGGIEVLNAWADLNVCNVQVTTKELALGGFWSNIARTTAPAKRSDLGQARMQLAQQLLAAIANSNFFGSAPSGAYSIAKAQELCRGENITEIKAAMSAMAAFNEGGDSGIFTPGASADAKNARAIALLAPWDVNN